MHNKTKSIVILKKKDKMSLFIIKQSKFLLLELDIEISAQFYETQHENSTKNTINTPVRHLTYVFSSMNYR